MIEKECCTGCGVCSYICPQKCISMKTDAKGFLVYEIDQEKCIHCKQCERICPVINPPDNNNEINVYAAKNRNNTIRDISSSGGIFTAIAEGVFQEKGIVCGAAFDNDFTVKHIIIEDEKLSNLLRGAKYPQSQVHLLYGEIEDLLKSDRKVLFVGTPCQTAAARNLYGTSHSLILVDIVCHGVASPYIWSKYLHDRISHDAPDEIIESVNLRDKKTGWSKYSYSVTIDYSHMKYYSSLQKEDPFMLGYTNNLYLRDSCHNCIFKGLHRCSDLTLGDYWGVWNEMPEFDDNKGVSLLLIHSEKGQKLIDSISEKLDIRLAKTESLRDYNPSIFYPSELNRNTILRIDN